jgi:hypothetical protein
VESSEKSKNVTTILTCSHVTPTHVSLTAAIILDSNIFTFESKVHQLEEDDSDVEDSNESETRAKGEGSVQVSISIHPCVLILYKVLD